MSIYVQFMAVMDKGGPVMWVIFLTACVVLSMTAWEGLRLFRVARVARLEYSRLLTNAEFVPPRAGNSPVAQLLDLLNWQEVENREDFAKEMQIHMTEIMPRLEGGLATIATLGTLLPMLGLLGTVTGMINVFEVVAVHGTGKPAELAYGISQALLTTAGGLIIAIPVIFLHHLLVRRVTVLTALTSQAMHVLLHRDIAVLKRARRHE
jgi:biopolymer transport protein ExbB